MKNKVLLIEEGSINDPNLRALLSAYNLKEKDVVKYRAGTNKPELVTIVDSELAQNPEIYKQQARDEILSDLYEFLGRIGDGSVENVWDNYECRPVTLFKMTYKGTKEDFIAQFTEFLDRNKG